MCQASVNEYPDNWDAIAYEVKEKANWRCIRCSRRHETMTRYVLTVHHFDGDKSNSAWWNLMALCQRCHLSVQNRVNPNQAYLLEHSEWIKPYVAGFYAKKYRGWDLSRAQVEEQFEYLLLLELMIR